MARMIRGLVSVFDDMVLAHLQVYAALNGQDRTLGHFVDLANSSGWKVTQVHRIPGTPLGHIVSVPA